MSLVARLVARAGLADPAPQDEVAPLRTARLVAKDRGMGSALGLRRAPVPATPPELPQGEEEMAPMPLRRTLRREEVEEADGPARQAEPEQEDDVAPRRSAPAQEEDTASPQARATASEEEAGGDPPRRTVAEEEEVAAPLRRSTPPREEPEAAAPRRAQAAPETTEEEAAPLRRATPDDLPPERPAAELRHDDAGASLDGTARPMRDLAPAPPGSATVAAPRPVPFDGAPAFQGGLAQGPIPGGLPDLPDHVQAPVAGPATTPAPERPRVVIDQIDVVVMGDGAPARGGPGGGLTGARALLTHRYLRGR